jgi:alpha-glucosidase
MCFNFPPLYAEWRADKWRECLQETYGAMDPIGAWPTWVLSNHDQKRHWTRYGSEARARAAAVLLLTLRGTPFLYMGEELGLQDATVPEDRVVDPGGRDGCRAPIPWDGSPGHGWPEDPWLPWPPRPEKRNLATLKDDAGSILHLYRRLIALRRESQALQLGGFELMDAPGGVLAYRRQSQNDERLVVINFGREAVGVWLDEVFEVDIASDGQGENNAYGGTVAPEQALVLRRSS